MLQVRLSSSSSSSSVPATAWLSVVRLSLVSRPAHHSMHTRRGRCPEIDSIPPTLNALTCTSRDVVIQYKYNFGWFVRRLLCSQPAAVEEVAAGYCAVDVLREIWLSRHPLFGISSDRTQKLIGPLNCYRNFISLYNKQFDSEWMGPRASVECMVFNGTGSEKHGGFSLRVDERWDDVWNRLRSNTFTPQLIVSCFDKMQCNKRKRVEFDWKM